MGECSARRGLNRCGLNRERQRNRTARRGDGSREGLKEFVLFACGRNRSPFAEVKIQWKKKIRRPWGGKREEESGVGEGTPAPGGVRRRRSSQPGPALSIQAAPRFRPADGGAVPSGVAHGATGSRVCGVGMARLGLKSPPELEYHGVPGKREKMDPVCRRFHESAAAQGKARFHRTVAQGLAQAMPRRRLALLPREDAAVRARGEVAGARHKPEAVWD